ncbi:hypothetical protein PACTADRAFT_4549 [Pachysolen tannophilus NRRL Y-2460]|uniref:M-phase phosphoprotein 6 n=1 Tax=Pachysolen tannophilus NRRL Y-2460 TaxID=669874 RepID=A0A1E4TPF3_PACTA|nr:hypothetical protein PACTADRAFT_4549 [Pachysolen tannophilus NRRL Y-2460]
MSKSSNGGFSSRVANMKFMRKAEQVEIQNKEEETESKLKDLSQWALPNIDSLKLKLLRKRPQFKQVGFSTLNQALQQEEEEEEGPGKQKIPQESGRRLFGGKTPEIPETLENSEPLKEEIKPIVNKQKEAVNSGKRKSNSNGKVSKKRKQR